MKLNYDVDVEKVYRRSNMSYKTCKIQKLIEEFKDSGKNIAKVVLGPDDHYSNPKSLAGTFYRNMKTQHMTSMYGVSCIGGEVYLIKKI
jgi:hypothetical protein